MYKLNQYDTFSHEGFDLPYEYKTLEEARTAAKDRMLRIKALQPDSSSGGQGFGGIQDRLYIIGPENFSERIY